MYTPPPPNFSTDLAFFQKMVFFAIGGGGVGGVWRGLRGLRGLRGRQNTNNI